MAHNNAVGNCVACMYFVSFVCYCVCLWGWVIRQLLISSKGTLPPDPKGVPFKRC